MSETLAVYGAGGHGKVVADAARASGWVVGCFIDDGPGRAGATFFGLPVVTLRAFLADASSPAAVVVGIGDNATRERAQRNVEAAGKAIATIVHPRAVIAPSAILGAGTVAMAGAVVNPDARVGAGVIVNTGAVIEHDCLVGDFAHLSPNAALGGGVRVGMAAHVGLGASVLPGITIGDRVRVGAGAAVIGDVTEGLTVVGVPARPVRASAGGMP